MSGIQHVPPRSGQQFTITHGDYTAVITELGATLRKLTYQGHDVIVPWNADQPVPCTNGELLIPFPNRIQNGTYTFEDRTYTLPIDEHERHTAIHGYGYRSFWKLETADEQSTTLSWRVPGIVGYPFNLYVTTTYSLKDDGLHIEVTAQNLDNVDAPWALAIHPWIANGFDGFGDEIDAQNAQCHVTIPARTHVKVDDDLIPKGTEPVEGTKYDLRKPTALTGQPFDDAWTDVEHDSHGLTTASFERPDGMRVRLGGDRTITSFQMCTGTGFAPEKHPSGVAIEPQTAYANAFNSGEDLIVLKPGSSAKTSMFISAEFGF